MNWAISQHIIVALWRTLSPAARCNRFLGAKLDNANGSAQIREVEINSGLSPTCQLREGAKSGRGHAVSVMNHSTLFTPVKEIFQLTHTCNWRLHLMSNENFFLDFYIVWKQQNPSYVHFRRIGIRVFIWIKIHSPFTSINFQLEGSFTKVEID